jgi:hypothetical protein
LHHLVGINAPEIAALDPAGMVRCIDAAPIAAAFEQTRNDPGLGAGYRR